MDPTITALIVACTSLAANLALLVKVITDKIKLTSDRTETKTARDNIGAAASTDIGSKSEINVYADI